MTPHSKVHDVRLMLDPYRGGFALEFCPAMPTVPHFALFDGFMGMRISTGGIMGARITNDLRVTCIDSEWDRGGVLLNSFFLKPNEAFSSIKWSRDMALSEGDTLSDPILVKQSSKDFEMWFGTKPLLNPATLTLSRDSKTLLSVWLSDVLVRHPYLPSDHPFYSKAFKPVVFGIRLDFAHLEAKYPLKALSIGVDDFK